MEDIIKITSWDNGKGASAPAESLESFLARCDQAVGEFSVLKGTEENQGYLYAPIVARRGNDYLLKVEEGKFVLYLQDEDPEEVFRFFRAYTRPSRRPNVKLPSGKRIPLFPD